MQCRIMSNKYITEIIPDFGEMADWARQAFEDGQFFHDALKRVADLERKLDDEQSYYLTACEQRDSLKEKLKAVEESWHLANGVADLAMKHRNNAEQELTRLQKRTVPLAFIGGFGWCAFWAWVGYRSYC